MSVLAQKPIINRPSAHGHKSHSQGFPRARSMFAVPPIPDYGNDSRLRTAHAGPGQTVSGDSPWVSGGNDRAQRDLRAGQRADRGNSDQTPAPEILALRIRARIFAVPDV